MRMNVRKFLSAACIAFLAVAPVSATISPASAASLSWGTNQGQLIQVQQRNEPKFERRGNDVYLNGKRGSRERRDGYREYNGYWFPADAFVGAIIGGVISGIINNSGGRVSMSQQHVEWCDDQYRSYRSSDNTFQPYSGPRQQCDSPYSR